MYNYPKTKTEWWDTVDEYWTELQKLIMQFTPTILDEAKKCKEKRTPNLARVFNTVWAAAPDSPRIHTLPAWQQLCDLCSEENVLYENEMP